MVWLALLLAVAEPRFSPQCEALKPLRVVSNDIEPPIVLHRVDPKLVGVNAIVIVGTIIDARGNVCDAKVLKGAGKAADIAAVAAVKQWRFMPARWHGLNRAAVYNITVKFKGGAPPKQAAPR